MNLPMPGVSSYEDGHGLLSIYLLLLIIGEFFRRLFFTNVEFAFNIIIALIAMFIIITFMLLILKTKNVLIDCILIILIALLMQVVLVLYTSYVSELVYYSYLNSDLIKLLTYLGYVILTIDIFFSILVVILAVALLIPLFLRVVEFFAKRLANYPKGPVIAAGVILAALGVLFKIFSG
jgi:hypothetical protein